MSYHVEVKLGAPIEQVVNDPQVAGKGADSTSGTMAANDCRVPTVRVQLTHSLKLPPNASMLAEVQLVGKGRQMSRQATYQKSSVRRSHWWRLIGRFKRSWAYRQRTPWLEQTVLQES